MATTLKQLKQINDHTKRSVFGYVREIQEKLSLPNIPILISYLCLSYYYHNEYFAKSGNEVEISNNRMTITKIKGNMDYKNTTYCNTWIQSTSNKIAKWTFKTNNKCDGDGMAIYICFVSNYDDKTNCDCSLRELKYMPNYGFDPKDEYDTLMYDNGESTSEMNKPIDCSKQFTIILNLEDKFIGYQYNSNDEVIRDINYIVEDIQTGDDIKYKLAINIYETGCGISLIDFDLQ
eukprot:68704_1